MQVLFHLLFARFYKVNQITSNVRYFNRSEQLRDRVYGLIKDKIVNVLDKAAQECKGSHSRESIEAVCFLIL